MFASVLTASIMGMEVIPVRVEADISDGLPYFVMVGYASAAVKEAQDRVRTALKNNGISLPPKRITVNLAPSDIKKEGSGFDLPVAAAVLCAAGVIPKTGLVNTLIVGELSLNGDVLPVSGVLPRVIFAREQKCRTCLIPYENLAEGRLIPDLRVVGVRSLVDVMEFLQNPDDPKWDKDINGRLEENKEGEDGIFPKGKDSMEIEEKMSGEEMDFSEIFGQESARRAAEIAVCGFHNLLFIGPPGAGKTMIARRFPTIMPPLDFEESLELTRIYSIAGLLSPQKPLITTRPFRNPHHTSSPQALAGGGRIPGPGEITLSHRGVLFLDELPEFSRRTLETLRQPLEDKEIVLSRASGTYIFPANFMLVAASNPCPCGYYPDFNRCRCSPGEVKHYLGKISQPLLDRIDLCADIPAVTYQEMTSGKRSESSRTIRERVLRVQAIQRERYKDEPISYNAHLKGALLEKYCTVNKEGRALLEQAYDKMNFSARSYHKILKVARTIADMDEKSEINAGHIAEALSYRALDKKVD